MNPDNRMEINVRKKYLPALLACISLVSGGLAGCSRNTDRGDGSGHMYGAALQSNPKSLDPQYAQDASSATVIKNMYSGLMMKDESGSIVCCNAESYEVSGDGCVYTFTLRDDNYWFFDENEDDVIDEDEYFPVTAHDYVFALRRILDPKMHSPYAKYFSCIKNASRVMSGGYSTEGAGVAARDDHTLEITLEYPCAEFLGLLTTPAAYPCNESFFLSTKGRYGLDDRSVMSNGPFYVRQWFYDPYGNNNILYMRKNTVNENDDYEILPSYVSFLVQDSEEEVRECFKNDETECFSTLNVGGYNPKKYSISGQEAITLGLIFNPGDSIYSNPSLRRAIAYATDRSLLSGKKSTDMSTAYGIIPPAVDVLGRSYRELVTDGGFDCFDGEKAKELLENAKKELNVSSLESVKIIVDTSTVDSGYLHSLSQSWQEILGIYIGIEDLTPAEFESRIAEGDYSIALYPLRADFDSGISVIDKFETVPCLKYAAGERSFSEDIMKSTTVPELVGSYSAAEQAILEECGFIPLFYKNCYLVADRDNEDIVYDPFTGSIDYRIAKNYS